MDILNNTGTSNSTGNVTEQWENYTKSPQTRGSSTNPWEDIRKALVSTGIFQTIGALVFNIAFIVIILSHRKLRCRPFYWHILGLCTADLIEGVICRPFATSYNHNIFWLHGSVFCKIWIVLDWTSFTLSTTILISLCIDRLEAKLSKLGTVSVYREKVLPVALCLFPWIFVLCVCFPMIIAGEEKIPYYPHSERHCFFPLKNSFYVPVFSVLYAFPFLTLGIASIIMITVFILKKDEWYRLSEDDISDDTTQNLRTSTIATLLVSVVTLLLSLPFMVVYTHSLVCYRSTCAILDMWTHIISYILTVTTPLVTPLFWLVHTEIRQAYKDSFSRALHKFGLCLHWRPFIKSRDLIQSQGIGDFEKM